jgi:hypothetical protein
VARTKVTHRAAEGSMQRHTGSCSATSYKAQDAGHTLRQTFAGL